MGKERSRVSVYVVQHSTASVYFVCRQGSSQYRRVDSSHPSCSRSTYDQVKIACCHIVATLQLCNKQGHCFKAFHHSYLVSAYAFAFEGKGIELPLQDIFDVDHSVKPSPFYEQASRRVTRRIVSAGEVNNKTTYVCCTCSQYGHNKHTRRRHSKESVEASSSLVSVTIVLPTIDIPTLTPAGENPTAANHH